MQILNKVVKRFALFIGVLMTVLTLGGCSLGKTQGGNQKSNIEYTLIKAEDVPETFKSQIDMEMKQEFDMVYSDGNYMYIAIGYGELPTGGYNISLEELVEKNGKICIRTRLHAPEDESNVIQEFTCPYLVIKLEDSDRKVAVNRY